MCLVDNPSGLQLRAPRLKNNMRLNTSGDHVTLRLPFKQMEHFKYIKRVPRGIRQQQGILAENESQLRLTDSSGILENLYLS
jgi:hypothetical protein